MTKQHFARLAKIAQLLRQKGDDEKDFPKFTEHQLFVVADAIADACMEFNPRFDYQRFIAACKVEEPL